MAWLWKAKGVLMSSDHVVDCVESAGLLGGYVRNATLRPIL